MEGTAILYPDDKFTLSSRLLHHHRIRGLALPYFEAGKFVEGTAILYPDDKFTLSSRLLHHHRIRGLALPYFEADGGFAQQ